jgi:hypothetical protein
LIKPQGGGETWVYIIAMPVVRYPARDGEVAAAIASSGAVGLTPAIPDGSSHPSLAPTPPSVS